MPKSRTEDPAIAVPAAPLPRGPIEPADRREGLQPLDDRGPPPPENCFEIEGSRRDFESTFGGPAEAVETTAVGGNVELIASGIVLVLIDRQSGHAEAEVFLLDQARPVLVESPRQQMGAASGPERPRNRVEQEPADGLPFAARQNRETFAGPAGP